MDLSKLFEVQSYLDDKIERQHGLVGENLIEKKILALLVEVGELANELPEVFKFWSNKKNNHKKALKEYVDCIHFLLSIGNDLGFNNFEPWSAPKEKTLSLQFNEVFRQVSTMYFLHRVSGINQNCYELTFAHFITLAKMLGFTWEEIEAAYMEKNKVNHQRQESGY